MGCDHIHKQKSMKRYFLTLAIGLPMGSYHDILLRIAYPDGKPLLVIINAIIMGICIAFSAWIIAGKILKIKP
jgi:ABC-type enterobactin transport system permease subunit